MLSAIIEDFKKSEVYFRAVGLNMTNSYVEVPFSSPLYYKGIRGFDYNFGDEKTIINLYVTMVFLEDIENLKQFSRSNSYTKVENLVIVYEEGSIVKDKIYYIATNVFLTNYIFTFNLIDYIDNLKIKYKCLTLRGNGGLYFTHSLITYLRINNISLDFIEFIGSAKVVTYVLDADIYEDENYMHDLSKNLRYIYLLNYPPKLSGICIDFRCYDSYQFYGSEFEEQAREAYSKFILDFKKSSVENKALIRYNPGLPVEFNLNSRICHNTSIKHSYIDEALSINMFGGFW